MFQDIYLGGRGVFSPNKNPYKIFFLFLCMKLIEKKIILELILLFSGVFVFRSLWTLMDKVDFLNQVWVHLVLLIVGTILSIFAIRKYSK